MEKQRFNFMTNNRTAMGQPDDVVPDRAIRRSCRARPGFTKQIDAFIEGHSGRQPQ